MFIITAGTLLPGTAEIFDYESPSRSGTNYLSAQFRAWIPESTPRLNGALVVVPENNADGRPHAETGAFRSWAERNGFAVIGCFFTGSENQYYSEARGGSGQALIEALRAFSDLSDRRELFRAHLLIYGFSTGAQFAYGMACEEPDRVISFIADKGIYFTSRPRGDTYEVPGLFIVGEDDPTPSGEKTRKLFSSAREREALWALVELPGEAHQWSSDRRLDTLLKFFEAAASLRLADKNPTLDLEKVNPWDGIFLEQSKGAIVSGEERKPARDALFSWLPNRPTAESLLSLRSSKRSKR